MLVTGESGSKVYGWSLYLFPNLSEHMFGNKIFFESLAMGRSCYFIPFLFSQPQIPPAVHISGGNCLLVFSQVGPG